jgi:UDP-glucose 4-epimerase
LALYLITGGAGFIGSHLADRLLADGHQVRILDDFSTGRTANIDPLVEIVRGDIRDDAAVAQAMRGVAGCFHLAAIASVARSNEAWRDTHSVNLTGTIAVLQAARDAGHIPVVYASSAAVYGNPTTAVTSEDARTTPLTAYGADKLGSELHARVAHVVHGVSTCGLRFFNVYGPRQDPASPYSGVISIFASRIAAGQPIGIHGDGLQSRDFIYVADVVAHLDAAMKKSTREPGALVFNVCTGIATTVLELAHTIARAAGRDAVLNHGPARSGDIRQSLGDPSAAIAELGVHARVALKDGLAITLSSMSPAG